MNKPTHDKTLSTYFGMEIASHTTRLAQRTRYQAACLECGRDLCDVEFSDVFIEDAVSGRQVMVAAIMERIEKRKCECAFRYRTPEFNATEAAAYGANSVAGYAYIGPSGKLCVA